MKFFLRKVLSWMGFLILTFVFFAMPISLQMTDDNNGSRNENHGLSSFVERENRIPAYFEFEGGSLPVSIGGSSLDISLLLRPDSAESWISLYVNGEREDMKPAADKERVTFTAVDLKPGRNEIAAVYHVPTGETLAVRRAIIFSFNKM